MGETEGYEEKSQFEGSEKEKLEIVKTIVAFANTSGGKIRLKNVSCPPSFFDTARLDDLVNKYAGPRLQGVRSQKRKSSTWEISIRKSDNRPHVFTQEASFQTAKGPKSAFYPGQIYVRHSSKTEPATGDDLQQIRADFARLLYERLAEGIRAFSGKLTEDPGSIPVRLSREGTLTFRFEDMEKLYPYTAKTLGTKIQRNQNWTAQALTKLGIKGDPAHCLEIKGASGKVIVRKYDETTLERLRDVLQENPEYNPYR